MLICHQAIAASQPHEEGEAEYPVEWIIIEKTDVHADNSGLIAADPIFEFGSSIPTVCGARIRMLGQATLNLRSTRMRQV